MRGFSMVVAIGLAIACSAAAVAQEAKGRSERVEAQKGDSAELWTLGDQSWDFKDVLAAYEPAKGHIESRDAQGRLAVWQLKLTKDFEEGAQRFHDEVRGSPFRIVLLDANRTTINEDLPATKTPVPARTGDTIQLYVPLPSADILRDVKFIRVQRRTDVGF